jgi:hypothetical protein
LLPQHARPTCQCCVNWSEVRAAVNDDSELVSWHLERSLAIFDVNSLPSRLCLSFLEPYCARRQSYRSDRLARALMREARERG